MLKIVCAYALLLGALAIPVAPAAALTRDQAWSECAQRINTSQYPPGDSRMTQAIEGCVAQKMREAAAEPASSKKKK